MTSNHNFDNNPIGNHLLKILNRCPNFVWDFHCKLLDLYIIILFILGHFLNDFLEHDLYFWLVEIVPTFGLSLLVFLISSLYPKIIIDFIVILILFVIIYLLFSDNILEISLNNSFFIYTNWFSFSLLSSHLFLRSSEINCCIMWNLIQ